MTMIHGKIMYEDGIYHIGVDPEEVYARVNQITERLKTS